MNQNTGKAPLIPIGTAGKPVTPAVAPSSVEKISAAATKQAAAAAQTATFTTPPPSPTAKATHAGPGRPRANTTPTKLKGVYFDPPVYDALVALQKRGQNVSKYINNVVRQALAV